MLCFCFFDFMRFIQGRFHDYLSYMGHIVTSVPSVWNGSMELLAAKKLGQNNFIFTFSLCTSKTIKFSNLDHLNDEN